MPDARVVATEILLAVMRGDEDGAMRLLDQELTESDRDALVTHARRVAELADGRNRCPLCGGWAADGEAVVVDLGSGANGSGSRWRWHRACHEVDLSRRASAGDRRAQMMLVRQAARRLTGT